MARKALTLKRSGSEGERKPNMSALSLFSGAGGMDIGVRKAGFDILGCVEMDPHCCATLRTNVQREKQKTQIFEADIRMVEPENLAKQIQVEPGNLTLLFGGPPCQSFSLAGKQKSIFDPRGMLLFQMVRFAEFFRPKVILMEQVKGLLSAKGSAERRGEVFEQLISDLEAHGYVSKWRVILAADFGVPQLRERIFLVATHGKNGFCFPERTHAPVEECNSLFPLKPYVTVGEVISDLGAPAPKIKGTTHYDVPNSHVDVTPARDRERIFHVPEGSHLAAQTHLGEELCRGLSPKDTTKFLRVHRKRPANTLRCGEIFYHPTENRYLTPREYMRLHGYPDSYQLEGPIRSRTGTVKNLDQHRQVANSVPPILAEVLANKIKEFLNEQDL